MNFRGCGDRIVYQHDREGVFRSGRRHRGLQDHKPGPHWALIWQAQFLNSRKRRFVLRLEKKPSSRIWGFFKTPLFRFQKPDWVPGLRKAPFIFSGGGGASPALPSGRLFCSTKKIQSFMSGKRHIEKIFMKKIFLRTFAFDIFDLIVFCRKSSKIGLRKSFSS